MHVPLDNVDDLDSDEQVFTAIRVQENESTMGQHLAMQKSFRRPKVWKIVVVDSSEALGYGAEVPAGTADLVGNECGFQQYGHLNNSCPLRFLFCCIIKK